MIYIDSFSELEFNIANSNVPVDIIVTIGIIVKNVAANPKSSGKKMRVKIG
jgi:hypothetical protein